MDGLPKARHQYYCDVCKKWHSDWRWTYGEKDHEIISCNLCGTIYWNDKKGNVEEKLLKDEIVTVLIVPDKHDGKLLVDLNDEKKEMFSYGLNFIPLNKFIEFFERNFNMQYGKPGIGFFVKTNCYDIIKEISELKSK